MPWWNEGRIGGRVLGTKQSAAAAPPSPEMGIGLLKWTWKCQGCQQQQRESQQSSELPVQKRLHCHFTSHSGLRLLRGAPPQKKVVGIEREGSIFMSRLDKILRFIFLCVRVLSSSLLNYLQHITAITWKKYAMMGIFALKFWEVVYHLMLVAHFLHVGATCCVFSWIT